MAAVATIVIVADRVVKSAIVNAIGPDQSVHRIDLIGNGVGLEYTENRGLAFGLLPGLGPLLVLGSVLIVGLLLFQFCREPAPSGWNAIALGAVIGGALGNVIDRLRFGYVVDYISVGSWPNFNVADSAITLGVIGLIWVWSRDRETMPAPGRK
ncbi:MAG: signal peptidase II [Thermomicrobiales bacterium]